MPANLRTRGQRAVLMSSTVPLVDLTTGFLDPPPEVLLTQTLLGILVNEILRENKSCVNECPTLL